jgi:hypothetical protein
MGFNGSIYSRANYEAAPFMTEVAHAGALDSELSPHQQPSSLGAAFAAVPGELGLQRVAGYRVVVEGRERQLKRSLRGEVYRIIQEAN